MKVDSVLGVVLGDEGKGKVLSHLVSKNKYDYCFRFGGGSNAGHTIIHNGKKIITHLIPSGIVHNIPSIIGHGCVINVEKFFNEIRYLEENGYYDCRKYIKVAYNAHIITPEHLEEDGKDTKIGTTKQGIGPCYRDKYARVGIRAESIPELQPFLIDIYEEIYSNKNAKIICEGSQAFGLDINWGFKYPYLTSSTCGIGGVVDAGFPPKSIRNIYGICKSYTTYSGNYDFQPTSSPYYNMFNQIGDLGKEYGATTNRRRKVSWLDLNLLKKAVDVNGVNILIVNKMDILQELNYWYLIQDNEVVNLQNEKNFKKAIKRAVKGVKVIFSYRPDGI